MEENKLYRVVERNRSVRYSLCEWSCELDAYSRICSLEEYTPPTPLELEQLDGKVKKWMLETGGNGIFDVAVVMQFYDFLKPLISSMLQQKDGKISQKERVIETLQDCISGGTQEIMKLQNQLQIAQNKFETVEEQCQFFNAQLQQKEERIKELESEKQTTNE